MILCYLLLFLPQLLQGTEPIKYFPELLGTSDFALFTQQNCARFIEVGAGKDGKCPSGLSWGDNMDAYDQQCDKVLPETVRPHLIRDVNGKNKPRILFVYVNRSNKGEQISYGVDDVSLVDNNSKWDVPSALKINHNSGIVMIEAGEALEDSIFDSVSNLLYLIIKSTKQPSRRLVIFYVTNIFQGLPKMFEVERKFQIHANNQKRSNWVENPYEHSVYYMSRNSSHATIRKLRMAELLPSLLDGLEGEFVHETTVLDRTLIWAHKGSMITLGRTNDDTSMKDEYFFRNITEKNGNKKMCVIDEFDASHRKTRRLIPLFDWDYCVLAYGGDGTKGADGHACPIYFDRVGESGSSNTIWIVVTTLFGTVIVVLIVYSCWLRSTLEDLNSREERKPVPYYPAGQPLDSTFDMSVDRWDQY